jgi:renalase
MKQKTSIAVIGAGISGLILTDHLKHLPNIRLKLYEKSRSVGGRMASRYHQDFMFDHGTQFFIARTKAFQQYLKPFVNSGLLSPWKARFVEFDDNEIITRRKWTDANHPHYVATPKMNAWAKTLATNFTVECETEIIDMQFQGSQWQLTTDSGQKKQHDWVVSTMPAPQAAARIPKHIHFHNLISAIKMKPCYALMLGLETNKRAPFDAALIRNNPLSWVSMVSSKPKHESKTSIVALTSNEWAKAHIHDSKDYVQAILLKAVQAYYPGLGEIKHQDLHRWHYANIDKQDGPRYHIDKSSRIACCGDWLIEGRVEGAYLSATALAKKIETILSAT